MAGGIQIKMNSGGMEAMLKSGEVRAELTRRAQAVLSAAQSSAPVVTGNYRNSLGIRQDTTDRAVVRVGSSAPHAHLVEAQSGVLARALDAAGGA